MITFKLSCTAVLHNTAKRITTQAAPVLANIAFSNYHCKYLGGCLLCWRLSEWKNSSIPVGSESARAECGPEKPADQLFSICFERRQNAKSASKSRNLAELFRMPFLDNLCER